MFSSKSSVAGYILSCGLAATNAASAAVIFDALGNGDVCAPSGGGGSWNCNGLSVGRNFLSEDFFGSAPSNTALAASFTVPTGQSYSLDSIALSAGVTRGSVPNAFRVDIKESAADGSPGSSIFFNQRVGPSIQPVSFGGQPAPQVFSGISSTQNVTLSGGSTYWLSLSLPQPVSAIDSQVGWFWNLNQPAVTGDLRSRTLDPATGSIDQGSAWSAVSTQAPAFRIEGTPVLTSAEPQVLYLNFDATRTPIPSALTKWWGDVALVRYDKPMAVLEDGGVDLVVDKVRGIYADYNILVTKDKPQTGSYSTIYIGGSHLNLPAAFQGKTTFGTLGIADLVDYRNMNGDDFAVVFSDNVRRAGRPNFPEFLAEVIAHESGHIFGLNHVLPENELMYPFNEPFRTGISDLDVRKAEPDPVFGDVFPSVFGCQNSFQELANNIGLANGRPKNRGEFCDTFLDGIALRFGLFGTLFDAELALLAGDDAGPTMFSLGDLPINGETILSLPISDQSRFALLGSSIKGGRRNVISSPFAFDLFGEFPSIESLVEEDFLLSLNNQGGNSFLNLYIESELGGFLPFGEANLAVPRTGAIPEPPILMLIALALVALRFTS